MVATALAAVAGGVAQAPAAPGAAIGREPQSIRINPENVRLNNYLHAGAYAGGFAGLAWERDRNAADVMVGTTISRGFTALFNIARELTGVGR